MHLKDPHSNQCHFLSRPDRRGFVSDLGRPVRTVNPSGGRQHGPLLKDRRPRGRHSTGAMRANIISETDIESEGELDTREEALMVKMCLTWKFNQNHSEPSLSCLTN